MLPTAPHLLRNSLGTRREHFEGLFEVGFVQIDITVVHFKRMMPSGRHDSAWRNASHCPARDCCVPEVMKVAILNAGFRPGELKRAANCIDRLTLLISKNALAKILDFGLFSVPASVHQAPPGVPARLEPPAAPSL
jgi:hypothetical protein